MPEQEVFESTLNELASYVRDLGDKIRDERVEDLYTTTVGDITYTFTGHRCTDGENVYLVGGNPKLRYASVVYYLPVTESIGSMISDEIARTLAQEAVEEERAKEEAAEILLDRVPYRQMESLKEYVYTTVSGENHTTGTIVNEKDSLTAVTTSKLIFPYEESFGIQEFYSAVESTVNAGAKGKMVLGNTLRPDLIQRGSYERGLDIDLP